MTNPIPSILHITDSSASSDTKDWPCCDVHLLCFEWLKQYCGVQLKLGVPNLEKSLVMTCDQVSGLKIDLDLSKSGGSPLTWEITYTKNLDNRWDILLDFASDGKIRFQCSTLSLKVAGKDCT